MYKVKLSARARNYYKRQPPYMKRRINKALDAFKESPLSGPHIRPLHGKLKGFHRYEVGGLRVVYKVDTKALMVVVSEIRTRGDVYK